MWIAMTKESISEMDQEILGDENAVKDLLQHDQLFESFALPRLKVCAADKFDIHDELLLDRARVHQVQIALTAEDMLLDALQSLREQARDHSRQSQSAKEIEEQGAQGFLFITCA